MAKARVIEAFYGPLLKACKASPISLRACADEPVYHRIARRKRDVRRTLREIGFSRGNFLAGVLTTRKR